MEFEGQLADLLGVALGLCQGFVPFLDDLVKRKELLDLSGLGLGLAEGAI